MNRNLFISFTILCLFSTLFLPILAFLIKPAKMQSETWIVTSAADSGWGTLRSCLQNATIGDTVTFDSSVFPPTSPVNINLTSELPHIIQGNLTIDASGAGVILNGNQMPADTVGLLVDSENNTIKGLQILHFPGCGIRLTANARACSISGNNITKNSDGIWLQTSSGNTVSGNNITANHDDGIWVSWSSNYNNISRNNIFANNGTGIVFWESSNYNTVLKNNITNNVFTGIIIERSSNYNTISGNRITNNSEGITLWNSSYNIITGNYIANKWRGINLYHSSINNIIFHNSFVNNAEQVYSSNSPNVWDNGFPSGGNYWSDYEEKYPDAKEMDDSGIWDTPYEIDENNVDNYPLVPEFPTWTSLLLILTVLTVAITIYKRRRLKTPTH